MTRRQKIRLSVPLLIAAFIVVLFTFPRRGAAAGTVVPVTLLGSALAAPPAATATAPVTGDPIQSVDTTTLTSYLASATAGQGVLPGVDFRGVDLDGRTRKGAALGMHLGGNAVGPFAPGTQTLAGVSLMNGGVTQEDVDLAFPADGPRWILGRTYNARQNGTSTVSNGYQGKNWFQSAQPEIQLVSNRVYLVYGADRFIELALVDGSSTTYRAVNGAAGAIVKSTNGSYPNTWTYTDQAGWMFTFFGFDDASSKVEGQIWKIEAPSGEVAYVGDPSLANDPITLGYNGAYIAVAYDSEDRRYTFTYTTLDSVERLTQVKVETKGGGTWSSPTGLETVGKVDYSYYSSETYGDPGDLKTVKTTNRLNDDGNELVREKYYRYWEGAFNASTNPGHPHSLQYVVDFEGVRRFDWAGDSTFDGDHLTAANATLAPFSSAYFEYDTNKRCIEFASEGGCGSCGGGSVHGTVLLTFEANGSFSGTSGYDTAWARRALVQRADGSFLTQYLDELGQPLSSLVTDATPATGSPNKWVTEVVRNSDGVTTQIATPAAVTGYTHSTGAVTSSNAAGLIRYWTLETTGATKGYVTTQTYNRDKNASQYIEWSRTFELGSLAVGGTTVYRPLVDDQRDYPVAITSGTTGSNLTTRAFTWHSGTLSPKEITVTWPTVTTANNGSNAATTSRVWLDAVGREVWTQAEDGVIDYSRYSGGLVTMQVRDADTTQTGSGQTFNGITMPGWTLGSGPFHRIDTMAYDDGFNRTATMADGQKSVAYASVLADRRRVSLSYPNLVSTTFHGPVQFSVSNHAGRSEAQGRVALTGNTTTAVKSTHVTETSADPLTALALGTVVRYSTSQYNDAGTEVATSRSYFDIPSSGAGTSGTHYDEETFGYDAMGRQNRLESPHAGLTPADGTVSKSTFDVLGRTVSSNIGTDDTGTGSDNMTVTELMEYDGNGDDGNRLLTKRTERTTSTSSGERVTTYAYDLRGNLLLTTGPTAPHSLVKYDNLGRQVARASYSGTAPAATADPESLATNRMTLSSSIYDERGRVCQDYFYNIDPADGSNDGSLRSDYWFDATGRTIQVEGDSLTKSRYDRLGRMTHSFGLAEDDTVRSYAAADDVSGDIVLVESQTLYESEDSDDVVMNVTIERLHDDHGGSATTGELDTNADGDALLLTAANVKGRAQISVAWYDGMGRLEDSVEYGTYGGATFDRDGLTVPARSTTALRTTFDYDDAGEQFSTVDPKGIERRSEFDDMGRQVAVIENYEDGIPETLEPDKDQIIRHGYTNGLRTTYTADLPGTDQVTTYYYGTTKGTSAGQSAIATTNLLREVAYPDSTGSSDRMSHAYNAQGQETWRKDQDGTILEKTYDLSGRLATDVASTLGTGIDGAVRRKEFAYDGLGRMSTATQYNATTAGTVLDQRAMAFGAWGRESSFSLDVDSTVAGGSGIGAYVCSMVHASSWAAQAPTTRSGARRVLPYSLTMPTGYNFVYRQGGAGYHEEAGRTNAVTHNNTTTLATFEFVGAARVSSLTLQAENFVMDHSGATSGSYPGWDNFNRQVRDQWVKAPSGINVTFLHREYKLDAGGFITGIYDYIEKDDDVGEHRRFDSLVTLDGLNRITRLERGELNAGGTTIAYESMDQQRTFDLVGNVTARSLDWNADNMYGGANEYTDTLTQNAVNEITAIDSDNLTWSGAGALTDDGTKYEYVHDAWGRMVQIRNQKLAVIANYRRDALDHLIGEQLDREPNSVVNGSDWWEYMVSRPGDMGMLASFKGSDPDALVERMWLGDLSWSATGSFNSAAVLETRDDDVDRTLDRGTVLFIDRTGSVMANFGDDAAYGKQIERLRYDMAGVPYLIPWGDANADGTANSDDEDQIESWWKEPLYNVRGDLDLDGDVDASDFTGEWGVLTPS